MVGISLVVCFIIFAIGNSKYVSLSGGNLLITAVDIKTDTGIYDCTASNHNGNMTDKAIGNML